MTSTGVVQVMVSGDDRDALGLIAELAVAAGLAACGQLGGPVTSVYRWEGAVERAEECILTLKTTEDRAEDLIALIVERHAYDTPEVLVVPVVDGHGPYLEWVCTETRPAS